MGGAKPTVDGLRAAARANAMDIGANDKGRVRVDVVWIQEAINDPRHYLCWYLVTLVQV